VRHLQQGAFGFTLLELIIVISLTALLGVVSVIGCTHFFARQKQQMMIDTLHQSLDFARQAAISHAEPVTLCAAASDQTCGSNWAQGILIFLDPQNTGRLAPGLLLLRVQPLLKQGKLIWRGWLPLPTIRFAADGLPHGSHGSFYLIQGNTEQVVLVINALGRIRE
jgi:hypothetical protein